MAATDRANPAGIADYNKVTLCASGQCRFLKIGDRELMRMRVIGVDAAIVTWYDVSVLGFTGINDPQDLRELEAVYVANQ